MSAAAAAAGSIGDRAGLSRDDGARHPSYPPPPLQPATGEGSPATGRPPPPPPNIPSRSFVDPVPRGQLATPATQPASIQGPVPSSSRFRRTAYARGPLNNWSASFRYSVRYHPACVVFFILIWTTIQQRAALGRDCCRCGPSSCRSTMIR